MDRSNEECVHVCPKLAVDVRSYDDDDDVRDRPGRRRGRGGADRKKGVVGGGLAAGGPLQPPRVVFASGSKPAGSLFARQILPLVLVRRRAPVASSAFAATV
jgi:hypothetical protein